MHIVHVVNMHLNQLRVNSAYRL